MTIRYVWEKWNGEEFIGYVSSRNRNTYPDNGSSGGYSYVYRGSDDIDPTNVSYSSTTPSPGQSITVTVTPNSSLIVNNLTYFYQYSINGGTSWTDYGATSYGSSITTSIPYGARQFQVRVRATIAPEGIASEVYVYGANLSTVQYKVETSASPNAGGTVSGGGTYHDGTSVTVKATAASGYVFVRWEENGISVSTSPSYTFTIDKNRDLIAVFGYTISLSASPTAGGTATGAGAYEEGTSVTVRATPASGYSFARWTESGVSVSTSASYTFTVTGNRTLVAVFTKNLPTYRVTVSADPAEGGTVSGGGTYTSGRTVTVQAVPATDFLFIEWQEDGETVSTNASYSFSISRDRKLLAVFKKKLSAYIGVEGKARKAVNLSIGVDGKARKVVHAYVGVDGKAKKFL